jgi:type I restriction enzyme S subunit
VKSDSGIFLVTAKNIKDGFIDYQHSKEYIPVDTFDDVMSRGQVQLGDVVITTEAPLGKVAQIDKEGIALAQRVIKYRGKSKVLDNNYFRHFLMGHTFQAELLKESTGSTVLGIKGSRLHKIKIAIPSLPEQTRIANCLSTWDRAITTTRKLLQQLDERKKGLMQGLLSGAVRVPGFEGAWEETKINDFGSTFNGLTGKTKSSFGQGMPYVSYLNVFRNTFIDSDIKDLVSVGIGEKQNTIKRGDIIFTTSSETPVEAGMSSVVLFEEGPVYLNSFCFGVRPFKLDYVCPEFMGYLFRSQPLRKKISALAQGSTRFNIGKGNFVKLSFSFPSLPEQRAIAKVLTTADQEIALYKRKLAKLEAQKKGLMQQLLTGQKRLSA